MRSDSMLGRQKDYAARRRFEDRGIFHSPHYIFHLSSREVAVPTITKERCNVTDGKSKTITLQYFSVIAYQTTEMEGDGRTFCVPPAPAPAVSGSPIPPSIPRPFLTARRES